ncbi:MAG: NAD-binding protein [Isosphaeraceae bacterium]
MTARRWVHRLTPKHLTGAKRLLIHVRFLQYILWEFRWPIGVLILLVFSGGLLVHLLYHRETVSLARACHSVFLMIFFESTLDFPDEWYLQPLFFLIPIVGLGAVADSVVRLAFLMFTKKQRLPEWQLMVASLYRNHVVVVGVGKVGFRVIQGLVELHEAVVAVELRTDASLLDEVYELGVPVIHGDGRMDKVLREAGVGYARSVILTSSDDLTNIDSGLAARDLNPSARIVLRLFDESLARKISDAFAMPAISTALVAAPAFVAAATGRKVYQPLQLAGERVHLTDLVVNPQGALVGLTVGGIQSDRHVNIVMHQGPDGVNVNPSHDVRLAAGDTILVIAPMERLVALEARNQAAPGGFAE